MQPTLKCKDRIPGFEQKPSKHSEKHLKLLSSETGFITQYNLDYKITKT